MNAPDKRASADARPGPASEEPAATPAAGVEPPPLRTLVICCFDPRAADVPRAVAEELGDIYPGDVLSDAEGHRIAWTATLFPVVVAGGRAADALRSVTIAEHLFGVQNVVVVHHTRCGAASYTPESLVDAFRDRHGADVSDLYAPEDLSIGDHETSLRYDVRLLRESKGTPAHVDIYGYLYDVDTGRLSRLVEDKSVAGLPEDERGGA